MPRQFVYTEYSPENVNIIDGGSNMHYKTEQARTEGAKRK